MDGRSYRKRLLHVLFGHDVANSTRIDKLRSEKHPATDRDFVYTINIMRCPCGLHWTDQGVELRDFDRWMDDGNLPHPTG